MEKYNSYDNKNSAHQVKIATQDGESQTDWTDHVTEAIQQ